MGSSMPAVNNVDVAVEVTDGKEYFWNSLLFETIHGT